jgi:hypothetical protein
MKSSRDRSRRAPEANLFREKILVARGQWRRERSTGKVKGDDGWQSRDLFADRARWDGASWRSWLYRLHSELFY